MQGLPFFLPLYSPRTRLILYSAHPPEELRCVLAGQMRSPYFPVLFEQVGAKIEFRQISCSEPTQFGDLEIDAFPLHHPQGSVGFRLVHPLRTAVYATDHEHGDPGSQCGLLFKSRDADVLIYDAQYTPAEYPKRVGWGHSTWLEATQVARRADVKQLVLFHHDPEREDDAVQCIEDQAREEFAETLAAYEGLVL